MFTDLDVVWWEDSHLMCGEELTTGIVARLNEADFGILLLSTRFFGRPFIRSYELPRFAGPKADKVALPVALSPLPAFGPERDLGGVDRLVSLPKMVGATRSYRAPEGPSSQTSSPRRFVGEL